MKKLAEFTDREIALMMGSLHNGFAGMHDALVAEAAYRLARASGAALRPEESALIDVIFTSEFRLRVSGRQQRRLKRGVRADASRSNPGPCASKGQVISFKSHAL